MEAVSPMLAVDVNSYVNESRGTIGMRMRLRFMQQTYGYELANLDALNALAAGVVAMGVQAERIELALMPHTPRDRIERFSCRESEGEDRIFARARETPLFEPA
jgi:hypothetical protein